VAEPSLYPVAVRGYFLGINAEVKTLETVPLSSHNFSYHGAYLSSGANFPLFDVKMVEKQGPDILFCSCCCDLIWQRVTQ
jgi:hypothetical protein